MSRENFDFYFDWLAVSLTAVTVALAVIAIFIGIASFVGFGMFKRETIKAAQEEATNVAQKTAQQEMEKYLQKQDIPKMVAQALKSQSVSPGSGKEGDNE